jgi:hypothetical protein
MLAMASPGIAAGLSDPSAPPDGHLLMTLAGFQAANPVQLGLSDVFTPLGVEVMEAGWSHLP